MITVNNMSLQFGGRTLFKDVNLKFTPGNCYGVIGANGAGKSTFLKILSGELDSTTGEVAIPKNIRMSVLKQDHYQYDDCPVLETVIRGNARLFEIMQEKVDNYNKTVKYLESIPKENIDENTAPAVVVTKEIIKALDK